MKIILLLFISVVCIYAQEKELSFFDAQDKQFDLSEYMSQVYGFIPVPIIITEPSVGYGGGVALVYLHDNLLGKKTKSGRRVPPSISGIIGAATENGTKIGGAFHIGYWREDTIRTTTYIGYPDIFIDIYKDDNAIAMNMKGFFAYQNVKFRVSESDFFIGASYMYIAPDISFDLPLLEQDFGKTVNISSVGLLADFDTRDNKISPNKGMYLSAKALFYDKNLGSDYTLQRYKASTLFFNQLSKQFNLDFNLIGETVNGEKIPPYLLPFVMMRGIPIMRYQGESILSLETQLTYRFKPRWSALVFGGVARTFGTQVLTQSIDFKDAPNIYAGGVGFRYLIAKKFGLRMGIDIAKSKNDKAFYIQFGSAWKGF